MFTFICKNGNEKESLAVKLVFIVMVGVYSWKQLLLPRDFSFGVVPPESLSTRTIQIKNSLSFYLS